MRNIINFFAILTFLIVGCQKTATIDTPQDEIDFKAAFEFFAQGLLKTETEVSLEDFRTNSEQFISILHELATELMSMDDGESIVFCLYFENEKLVLKIIENDTTTIALRAKDCKGWDACKKCRSAECVGEFMAEKMEEYGDCVEFRVEKKTFSATVYARKC